MGTNTISQNNSKKKANTNLKFYSEILIEDSYTFLCSDNNFIVLKTIDDNLLLIYAKKDKSIISYNIISNKIINEIKNAHTSVISNFRNHLDKINKRDLILSNALNDIKIWNIKNFECLLNINKINKDSIIYSSCFLNDNNFIYILTCNCNEYNEYRENIQVYDLNGNKIQEINDSNENAFLIDVYYDNKYSKNYIITGNLDCVRTYDYTKNKLYHKYFDKESGNHYSVVIDNNEKKVKLIEASENSIRIWNFHSGKLLNKIKFEYSKFLFICLWDTNFLFATGSDKAINLIDIKEKFIKMIGMHETSFVSNLKKIIPPQYGECLISQGNEDGKIILWKRKT